MLIAENQLIASGGGVIAVVIQVCFCIYTQKLYL